MERLEVLIMLRTVASAMDKTQQEIALDEAVKRYKAYDELKRKADLYEEALRVAIKKLEQYKGKDKGIVCTLMHIDEIIEKMEKK